MALFQKSIVEKYLEKIDESLIDRAYQNYSSIYVPKINRIKELTEEKYQTQFLQDIFGSVLGYTVDPDEGFNIELEKKNENDSKRVDGAIIKEDSVLGVIELKSTKTRDLEKVKDQAFGYKNNHKGCKYVISSNFHKLRFYVDDATEYEEFDLFNLSKSEFRKFYLYLRKEGLLDKDVPKLLKEETKFHEENISKKLYKDYSSFKNKVFENFVKNNPQHDKLILFKKSQKFLDRILFILFAEDKGLIPENAIPRIVKSWSEADDLQYKPLYDLFKIFFGHLNVGHKYKKTGYEIPAYNGGLFAPDKVLDNIIVDDEVLKDDLLILSKYDFNSEVDVNILGHIFEHSLSEIEEVEAELRGEVSDKSKSKRKKDGVFYTPKYITKYIVDNTIGKLCLDKRDELGVIDEEYAKGRRNRKKETIQTLSKNLEEYRKWLLNITICDPACGSGAFLNQALEFLIKEHQYIDELESQLLESPIVFNWVEDHILEKNLFGVDINEESVEIARLSLWLRTAKKGRKLTALNNNIKCGNSLIDNSEVAGDKAFNWQQEFPNVFGKGGFDVIIGNPPYVGEKGHAEIFDDLKKIPKWKEFYRRRSNIYYFFIKHGIDLLKDNGIQSLIIPREFTNADWANKVRETILENSQIIEIIDFSELKVFSDAGTTSLILTQQKAKKKIDYQFQFIKILIQDNIQNELFNNECRRQIKIDSLKTEDHKPWDFNSFRIEFNNKIKPLSVAFNVSQGIVSGSDKVTKKHVVNGLAAESEIGRGVFILDENIDIKFNKQETLIKINDEWITLTVEDINLIKPYYKPENLQKWTVTRTKQFIVYVGRHNMTENIKRYLLQYDKILLNRSTITEQTIELSDFLNYTIDEIKKLYSSAGSVQKIMRRKQWYLPLYERANVPFDSEKIVVNTKNMDVFTYSDKDLYSSGGGAGGQNFIYLNTESEITKSISEHTETDNFISYVNAILNSKIIKFIIKLGQYNQLSTSKIADLPIRIIDFNDVRDKVIFETINTNTTKLRRSNTELNTLVKNFRNYLFTTLAIQITKNWYDLEFSDFIVELNKSIKKVGGDKLTKMDEMEWMELFEDKKKEVLMLKAEIDGIDREIDELVYELYGLTEEEIKIVEES